MGKNTASYGEIIKKYRIMNNMTQADLTYELSRIMGKDIAPNFVTTYETGKRNPKLDLLMMMAEAMECDPVAMAGINLSRTDEIRLLMKLLLKHNKGMELREDGTVDIHLSEDFADYVYKYNENQERIEMFKEGLDVNAEPFVAATLLRGQLEEMVYYTETYPKYDAVTFLRSENKKVDAQAVREKDVMCEEKFYDRFTDYYDSYLLPMINKLNKQKH